MRGRITGSLLALFVGLSLGLSPCAALMMGAESGHECCDKPSQHSHDQKSSCELLCALADGPFTPADKQTVEKPAAAGCPSPHVADFSAAIVATQPREVDARPSDHAPPLYILHDAFLI